MKKRMEVISPVFYIMFMNCLANTVPAFLYCTGMIDNSIFIYFIFSELALILGFRIFYTELSLNKNYIICDESFSDLFYKFYLFLYVFLTLFSYMKLGIPLFKESRLETYQDAGGTGVIARITPFMQTYILIYSYHSIKLKKHKILSYFTISITTIFMLLSGSRGGILQLMFTYYLYNLLMCRQKILLKKYIKFIVFGIIIVLLAAFLKSGANIIGTSIGLVRRFIKQGDIYYMALPNWNIDKIVINNKIRYFFQPILAPLRLLPYDKETLGIGFQLTYIVYPFFKESGILIGPNSRPSIYLYLMFHYYGVLFMFFFGMVLSFIIFYLPRKIPRSITTVIGISYLILSVRSFFSDFGMGLGSLFDTSLNLFIYFICIFLFTKGKVKIRRDKKDLMYI
jgi:hypothetical protein